MSRVRKNNSDIDRPAMHWTAFLWYFYDKNRVHVRKVVSADCLKNL